MELFYSEIKTNIVNAILVTNQKGALYYASLGNNTETMIMLMKKDMGSLKIPINLHPATPNECINKTIQNYKLLLTPGEHNSMMERDISYEFIFGTSLQRRVWSYLAERIQSSKTVTYSQIADDLGVPKATRAIANACGANKIALVVPCHRAITKSGKVTGYRWGIPLKRKILDLEQNINKKESYNKLKYFRIE